MSKGTQHYHDFYGAGKSLGPINRLDGDAGHTSNCAHVPMHHEAEVASTNLIMFIEALPCECCGSVLSHSSIVC